MKPKALVFLLLIAGVGLFSGCASYGYRIVQPVNIAQPITDQPVSIKYAPLEYRVSRFQDRLGMTIINPTPDRITLRGDLSYVVDPRGASHPVRGFVLASHSYAPLLWPPPPTTVQTVYPAFYGPGWWPGYPYMWGGFYGAYYGPMVTYSRIYTPYNWNWGEGQARFHFSYIQNGKGFDHDFVILREREK